VVLGPLLLGGAAGAGGQALARPNVVLVVTDDLDARTVGYLPSVVALLAEQGATFPNAFATTPICCPSRASILRGQYVHNHGVLTNTGPRGGFPTFRATGAEASTLATWLQGAGYRTGLFGKYLNGYPKRVNDRYVPPGWDDWHAAIDHAAYDQYGYELNENGRIVPYGNAPEDYLTDVIAERARAFIAESAADDRPFFAYVATYAPHGPAPPAPRHAGAFAGVSAPRPPSFDEADVADKPAWLQRLPRLDAAALAEIDARYQDRLGSLLAVDELVAGLVETLAAADELDRTVIIFTSDNGFHLGEHRLPYGKQTPYDEAVRVPLLVRGPGVPVGSTVVDLALTIDLAPTVAALAGLDPPAFVDGRSLVPLWTGEGGGAAWRRAFLVELFTNGAPSQPGDDAAVADPDAEFGAARPPAYAALRTADLLYVEYADTGGERELYDLAADPYQLDNLAGAADPALLAALGERLGRLRACAADECRAVEAEPPPSLPPATPGAG